MSRPATIPMPVPITVTASQCCPRSIPLPSWLRACSPMGASCRAPTPMRPGSICSGHLRSLTTSARPDGSPRPARRLRSSSASAAARSALPRRACASSVRTRNSDATGREGSAPLKPPPGSVAAFPRRLGIPAPFGHGSAPVARPGAPQSHPSFPGGPSALTSRSAYFAAAGLPMAGGCRGHRPGLHRQGTSQHLCSLHGLCSNKGRLKWSPF